MAKRKYSGGDGPKKKSKSQCNIDVAGNVEQNNSDVIPAEKELKASSFDVKHFRKELAGKQGQTIALTQFLKVCLNPDSDADYVLEYLKAGGNSHEILRQVHQDNKKNLTLATPAFHLFHLIILKVQSSSPHMIVITEEACRFFLNNYMSTVEIMISENSGPRHRKIILKLFTSMVTLNPDLGIEILNQAPLTSKHLQYILEKPNYKEKDNVRTAFVHFMTSFLVDGHLPLIKALLEKQGLLSLVVPGLIHDEAEAVLMFLNILKQNVIDNILISKSLKLKTFSHNVLHQMFKLYLWKGPPDLGHDVINELRPEISKMLSEILRILFTSHKLGLYFMDKTLGTADANKNQNLYKALLSLKRPWENQNQCDMVLEIVYKCPDLHRAVISLIEHSFEPQNAPIWERSVEFMMKLLVKLKPEDMVLRFNHLTSVQVSNFIRFTTLPVSLLKFMQTSFGKVDQTVSMHCIKVLVKMLSTLKRYMQILAMDNSNNFITDLKNKLDYFLPKHLPTPNSIVTLIQGVINRTQAEETNTSKEYTLPKIDEVESMILLTDLLLLYNDIHPAHFETLEGNLNMKEILDFSGTINERQVSLLKFKIVSLWLAVDSSIASLRNPMFKELFQIMLEVYTSDNDYIWVEAKDTIINFFKNTCIFEADEDEIHIILYALRVCEVDTSIVSDIVEYVLGNTNEFTEIVRTRIATFDVPGNSKNNLDKLLNDLMKGKVIDDGGFLENKVPSPFIVGSIKYIQENKVAKKSLKQFLAIYITHILHSNYTPELTETLIPNCKLDVNDYLKSWKESPVALEEVITGKDIILKNISDQIINNEEKSLVDIFTFLEETSLDESEFVLEVPYKIKDIPFDSSKLLIWAKYVLFCLVRLTITGKLHESQQKNIRQIFECIIVLGKRKHMVDICRTIIFSMFKNPHFLQIYTPIDSKTTEPSVLATNFILETVDKCKDIVDYLNQQNNILKAFRQKNCNELMKILGKTKKIINVNSLHTIKVLETVEMSAEDDLKILDQIFTLEKDKFIKEDKEPTIALDVLTVLVTKYASKYTVEIPAETLKQIITLYSNLITETSTTPNLNNIETALIGYFENKPYQAKLITEDHFKSFFSANAIRKTTAQLASTILKLNSNFCGIFKEQIGRPEIISQRELSLPLGNAILKHTKFLSENKQFLEAIYAEYKSNIFKLMEKPHKAGQIYMTCFKFVEKMLLECTPIEDCYKFFNKVHKFEVIEEKHLYLVKILLLKLCLNSEKQKKDYLTNYILALVGTITQALKESKNGEVINQIVTDILDVLDISESKFNIENKEDEQKTTQSSIWQNFCKAVLKESLKSKSEVDNTCGPKLLLLLTKLVHLFYPRDHEDLSTLFDMVTSHSEFLKVMLSNSSLEIKTRLVEFLYTLIIRNKSVMKPQQIPVYLSAYHATRSRCDRAILAILYFYETNGQAVNEYKPYLFGDSAANYYSVRKSRASSLWAHPTPNQIMNLFEREAVERTIRKFPVNQQLEYSHKTLAVQKSDESVKNLLESLYTNRVFDSAAVDNETAVRKMLLKSEFDVKIDDIMKTDVTSLSYTDVDENIYDPAFVFPLLSHLLAPGSLASCFKLMRTGLLSLPVMALSSYCPKMRAAAYHVLHRYSLLLETETKHKNDKILLTDFIETLRHSLSSAITFNEGNYSNESKNPRLPALGALFLAESILVATSSSDPLYKPVNNFLIAKQHVDLTVVPDFLSLFHDSDVESADRRNWILEIIKDGARTMTDVNVIFKTMCLKMVMDFYSSLLSDRKAKERILGVIEALVTIPRAFEILVEGYGLISWIHSVVKQMGKADRSLLKHVLKVVRNMAYSLHVNALIKTMTITKKTEKSVTDVTELIVNKDLEHDVLLILYDLMHFSEYLEEDDYVMYLKTFNFISKRAVKLMSNKKQMLCLAKQARPFVNNVESLDLMTKALLSNNAEIFRTKSVDCKDDIIHEIFKIFETYLS